MSSSTTPLIKEPETSSNDMHSASDFASTLPAGSTIKFCDFVSTLKRVLSAMRDSPDKRALEHQVPYVFLKMSLAKERDIKVQDMLLGLLFDPKCPFTPSHAAVAADLLSSNWEILTPSHGRVSVQLIQHLAAVVRSPELRDRPADPSSRSLLFLRWCELFRDLAPEELESMVASGILSRLFGLDMLRAAENKVRFDQTHDTSDIKLRTRNALRAMPHVLRHFSRAYEENSRPIVSSAVAILESLRRELDEALSAREPPQPASEACSEIAASYDRADEGPWRFFEEMRTFLAQADAANDASAIRAVGVHVMLMLRQIMDRQAGVYQRGGEAPASGQGKKRQRLENSQNG